MTNKGAMTLVAVSLVAGLARNASADRDDSSMLMLGYGQLYQTRLDVESSGHLPFLGLRMNFEEMLVTFSFQLAVDQEYTDVTQYALEWSASKFFASEVFGFYIGGCFRSGIDGYPDPSWSPLDLGVIAGIDINIGDVVAIGADARGWLGWHWYSPRGDGDAHNEAEPYFDWRVYIAIAMGKL